MSSQSTGSAGLEGRYAAALFDLAEDEGLVDRVADDLGELAGMIGDSEDLVRLIRSPVLSRADQGRAMTALLDKAGMSQVIHSFVGVITRNRRLFALPAMIRAYQRLLAEHRGETTAEVTSAKKLSEKQLAVIGATLKKEVGGKVAIDARVDPGLLGGLVVKVGSRMVDSSLRTKLQRLRLAMIGP